MNELRQRCNLESNKDWLRFVSLFRSRIVLLKFNRMQSLKGRNDNRFQNFRGIIVAVVGTNCKECFFIRAGGIIGPYFFKNDEGHNVTVNGDRYRAMITNFFFPELNNHDVQELWFQQDGATCHTARATIDLLKDTFGDRLILRFGPVNWPPRSCDLTPLDYFLWGYVKSLVYADKPQTLNHLEDNIRRVIADIRPQMLEKVIENWTSRLDYIRANHGSHMPEIIFKI
ncbi:putative transposable element [Trichonephila clavipes]|nr:putative transposable element [Trichonephila clavipes]